MPKTTIIETIVRAAADLAQGATEESASVSCEGAREVVFILTSTGGNVLTSATPQVSEDDTNFVNVGAASASTSGAVEQTANIAVNPGAAGRAIAAMPLGSTNAPGQYVPWKKARLRVVAPGTGGAVSALKIVAKVFFDQT